MQTINKKYLISPVIDFLLIGGMAIFSYLVLVLVNFSINIDIVFLMVILAFFVNSPHFMISYIIFYKSAKYKLFRSKSFFIAGVLVPVVLLFFIFYGFVFISKDVFYYLLLCMFFLVGWHYIKQAYGCFIVYSAGNQVYYNKFEQNIIKFSLYPLWIFSFLRLFTSEVNKEFWGFQYSVPAVLISFKNVMEWMSVIGVLLFLVLLIHNIFFIKKKPNLTALTSIVVIYIWLSPLLWDEIYFYMIPFFHSLQYFLFSGAYTKNKIHDEKSGVRGWLIWWGSAFILGALFFDFIPNFLDGYFSIAPNITPHLFLISFVLFINIHHYFIDSVIWKGSNPDVRKYLKFKSIT
ncbi:hypothetical protein [Acinetobacter junii]|uniref:hypothetical protein n=4 Tax=Acinetobacter junii TaxID=40215 RepID=UPI001250B110|nr:hypothetical protein [Acinetobacter junii]MQZ55976.1 hypothetical protein [Acinetobacter junii]